MLCNKLPIFFTFNNDYCIPAAVAFYSLLNSSKGTIWDMYVLHNDISSENQELLNSIVERFNDNCKLSFIKTGNFLDQYWSSGNFNKSVSLSKFTVDTIVRCFPASLLPKNIDRIIYSDVDVIFVKNIAEIYDVDLEDCYLAGIRNAFSDASDFELSHLSKENYELLKDSYLAGGLLVFNLKKIRNDNLEEKMFSVIMDDTIEKRWNDQDILNISCKGKVNFLKLNYISYPYLYENLVDRDNPLMSRLYTRDELYDSLINPYIIHFAAKKPWNSQPNYSNLWWTIFDYLKLPQSSIFKVNRFEPKIKRTPLLIKNKQHIAIWGTGSFSKKYLAENPSVCVDFFIDNNIQKNNTEFCDKKVFHPSCIENFMDVFVIVVSSYHKEISKQLASYGMVENIDFMVAEID